MNQMEQKQLKTSIEKNRADQILVARGLFESRAKAQEAIEAGLVFANGCLVRKASQVIAFKAQIMAQAAHPYVSRGGLKLAHALQSFEISAHDKICLDVGASTGGFCDVLLRNNARHIYAVDTGRDQFQASLRGNSKITLMESQDIRTLKLIAKSIELTVIDVSFISLKLVLPDALAFSTADATMIALIKPQFEVGKANIGKGGIVKNEALYEGVFEIIIAELNRLGWQQQGTIIASPVTGGDGNKEFLIAAKRGSKRPTTP